MIDTAYGWTKSFAGGFSTDVMNSASAVVNTLGIVSEIPQLSGLKIFSAGGLVIAASNLKNTEWDSIGISNKKTFNTTLGLLSDLGNLIDATATVVFGLESFKILTATQVAWASPLYFVGAGLSVAGIALDAVQGFEAMKTEKKFRKAASIHKKTEDYTIEDFQKGMQYLNQKRKDDGEFFISHFQKDEEAFISNLSAIEKTAIKKMQSPLAEDVAEAKQILHSTVKLLAKKITHKKHSHCLNILISLVGIVSLFIMMCTPLIIPGYALMAIGCGISLYTFFKENREKAKMDQELLQCHGRLVYLK